MVMEGVWALAWAAHAWLKLKAGVSTSRLALHA
jgi:hypothetical protein